LFKNWSLNKSMKLIRLCCLLFAGSVVSCQRRQSANEIEDGMFVRATNRWLSEVNSRQRNYGVAVSDVDNDGQFEMIVAGYSGPNLVLKYDSASGSLKNIAVPGSPYEALMDTPGNAIGVAACDLDGDGREEIYFLNTNQAYAGRSAYGDKMFKFRDGRYVDLYSEDVNQDLPAKEFAGRSVACLDRDGDGTYGFVVATYSSGSIGRFALVEMDKENSQGATIKLKNAAGEAGIERATGGRGIAVGPILQDDGKLDIFFDNEGSSSRGNSGANFLFKNQGDGTFRDVARETGVEDGGENGRGIALADFNGDGLIDVTYGNWNGVHRMFIQTKDGDNRYFRDVATSDYSEPSLVRTVIAADFDNDGHTEVFFNNIDSYGRGAPNKVFRVKSKGMTDSTPEIKKLPIGDALETEGHGTGGAVADLNGDGVLDLLLSHGESTASQALELYQVNGAENNDWIRVMPLTKQGAPARGATVYLSPSVLSDEDVIKTAVIDSGSGYLCQMEPVAHFGLGNSGNKSNLVLRVRWPDGSEQSKSVKPSDLRRTHVIPYPK